MASLRCFGAGNSMVADAGDQQGSAPGIPRVLSAERLVSACVKFVLW